MTASSQIFAGTFLPKIIKIVQYLTKLRLMIAGMFFLTHGVVRLLKLFHIVYCLFVSR